MIFLGFILVGNGDVLGSFQSQNDANLTSTGHLILSKASGLPFRVPLLELLVALVMMVLLLLI